jgi:hypothetical protein
MEHFKWYVVPCCFCFCHHCLCCYHPIDIQSEIRSVQYVVQIVDMKGISQPTGSAFENLYISSYFWKIDLPHVSYSTQTPSAYPLKIHRWTAKYTNVRLKM